jgi:hypothetical protein
MTRVEIIVTLLSFIWVLALTHVLQALRELWLARARVKASASQLMWMVATLVLAIVSWLPMSALDDKLQGWVLAVMLAYAMVIYFIAGFVSPRVPEDGVLDLAEYEAREGGAYKVCFLVTAVLVLPMNYLLEGMPAWPQFLVNVWFLFTNALLTLISLWRPERWVRTLTAAMILATLMWNLATVMALL